MQKTKTENKYIIPLVISTFIFGILFGWIISSFNGYNIATNYINDKLFSQSVDVPYPVGVRALENRLFNLISNNETDFNDDGKVDLQDVLLIAKVIKEVKKKEDNANIKFLNNKIDFNNDGKVDVLDGIIIVDIVKEADKLELLEE